MLRTVLFAPEDLALVAATRASGAGSSTTCWSLRRPRFAGVRADYDRVLKQRVALLKTAGAARGPARAATCVPWTSGTAISPAHGAELLAGRLDLVAELRRAGRRGVRARWRRRRRRSRSTYRSQPRRRGLLPGTAGRAGAAAARRAGPVPPARRSSGGLPGRPAPRRPGAAARAGCRRRGTRATASRGRSRSRCGWVATELLRRTASSRC